MDGTATMSNIRQSFRTPLRILLPKLLKSRDDWKAKSDQRKAALKAARITIRDLTASRALWRQRSAQRDAEIRQLRQQLEQSEHDRAGSGDRGRADRRPKKVDPVRDSAPPRGGQYPVAIISLSLKLVLEAGSSLRGAAATLALLVREGFATFDVPCPSTIRMWLLRVGHDALTRPLDRHAPWLWLVDHTIQIGVQKILVILGCPMDQVPRGRALQLADLQLVALVPMEKSNGVAVAAELERATQRTGVPRLIVADQGPDLRKGISDFQSAHPQTAYVPDVSHYGANLLEQAWDDQVRWQSFIKELQQTGSKLRQTRSAYLLAPRMRTKARFMNVGVQLRFARRVRKLLERPIPNAKALEYYGWLSHYRADLAIWEREHGLVETTIALVRVQGLHARTLPQLAAAWGAVGERASTERIVERLREYVTGYQSARAGERFVASTEILESSFGKLKRLEGDQRQDGMTGLVLALGMIVGRHGEADLKRALEATPQKKVQNWVGRQLGHSMQWLRRQFFQQTKA